MDLRQGKCPSCGHSFRVPATITAARVRCPKCKGVVELTPAPAVAAPRAGGSVKRPARGGVSAARSGDERRGERAASGGAKHHHEHSRRHGAQKKSPLPFVLGGVALVALVGALVFLSRDKKEHVTQAAPPAAVPKPDFSALADLAPAEGTSPEDWAQMNELMTKYITPPFDKNAERSGDLMMHKGKAGVPAIINAFKRI